MVTLRRYFNVAEAAVEKTRLVAIGLALIGLYFYTRRAIRAERDAFWRTKSQNRGLHLTPG